MMVAKRGSLILLAAAVAVVAAWRAAAARESRSADVAGTVFLDRNGNGAREAGEPGVAGVAVSDQVQVAVTGADGSYRLPDSRGFGVVFVSVPDGYRAVGPFWRRAAGDSATLGSARTDFPLAATPRVTAFAFVHASDTHLSDASLPRTRRLRALVDSLKPALVLVTGDLVKDALRVGEAEARGYFEMAARELRALPAPTWVVPGNHDNFGIERQLSHVEPTHPLYGRAMYRSYFGPDYYSFTYGGVHFVGLNTVDFDDQWYYGHVDSTQLAWLERDLAAIPATTPVVTFDHIPLASAAEGLNGYTDRPPAPSLITVGGRTVYRHTVSNAADVLRVLRARRLAVALGGHVHMREHLDYLMDGVPTRFHQAAAVVGDGGGAGRPMPSGLTLYHVRAGVVDDGQFVPLGAVRP